MWKEYDKGIYGLETEESEPKTQEEIDEDLRKTGDWEKLFELIDSEATSEEDQS